MATEGKTKQRSAPYAPASAMSALFDHIRYVKTPDSVDSGLLEDYGISHSNAFALLSALKFLNLVDSSGKPTEAFRDLQTGGDEFKIALNQVLEKAYSGLFSRLDVGRDSKDKIVNYFARNYSPATANKAAILFLDLCGEAGITTSAQPRQADPSNSGTVKVKRQPTPPKGGQKKGNTGTGGNGQSVEEPETRPRVDIRINSQDLAGMTPEQIEAIFSGLAKLGPKTVPVPPQGNGTD